VIDDDAGHRETAQPIDPKVSLRHAAAKGKAGAARESDRCAKAEFGIAAALQKGNERVILCSPSLRFFSQGFYEAAVAGHCPSTSVRCVRGSVSTCRQRR